MKAKNEYAHGVSREFLQSLFDYRDGRFYRKHGSRIVGWSDNKNSYRRIQIGKNVWLEHRLVWVYHHGEIPEGFTIDHRDMVRDNNKVENLRLATRSEQNKYQSKRRGCTSEYVGVYLHSRDQVYIVQVATYENGVKSVAYNGRFECELAAAKAREKFIIDNDLSKWNPLNF